MAYSRSIPVGLPANDSCYVRAVAKCIEGIIIRDLGAGGPAWSY